MHQIIRDRKVTIVIEDLDQSSLSAANKSKAKPDRKMLEECSLHKQSLISDWD
jgi:hypothetical protein